jgi:hypothetical protein
VFMQHKGRVAIIFMDKKIHARDVRQRSNVWDSEDRE